MRRLLVLLAACSAPDAPAPTVTKAAPVDAMVLADAHAPTMTSKRLAEIYFVADPVRECLLVELVKEQPDSAKTLLDFDRVTAVAYQNARAEFDGDSGAMADGRMSEIAFAMAIDDSGMTPKARAGILGLANKVTWPLLDEAAARSAGVVVEVQTCTVANHVALGTCVADGRLERAGAAVSWRVTRVSFDVADTVDSDAAMKTCLRLRGRWTAATGVDVGLERARQHSRMLH